MPVAKLIDVDRGCASHRVDLQWEYEASRKKLKTVSYCLLGSLVLGYESPPISIIYVYSLWKKWKWSLNYHELYANHYVFLVCFSVAINIHLFYFIIFSKPNIYDLFALFLIPSLLFCRYQFNFEVNIKKMWLTKIVLFY